MVYISIQFFVSIVIQKQIKEYNLLKYNVFLEAGYIDKNGKLWLGSSKGELYLFENGKLTLYLKKQRKDRKNQ